mmetsp:Transcript_29233/g.83558  ORF Transcript_29233/g.83558 Transcript_29233/m.83558 type:complete len:369 (-) Transcript_29233:176-1282(-)
MPGTSVALFTWTTLSPGATAFPAAGPPTHCLFHASMAPPGTTPFTWSTCSPSLKAMSSPTSTPLARRSVKPKMQPPPSQCTNGEAGTIGDLSPKGVPKPGEGRGVRCGVRICCGVRGGVPGTVRLPGPGVALRARCGVATGCGVRGACSVRERGTGLRRPIGTSSAQPASGAAAAGKEQLSGGGPAGAAGSRPGGDDGVMGPGARLGRIGGDSGATVPLPLRSGGASCGNEGTSGYPAAAAAISCARAKAPAGGASAPMLRPGGGGAGPKRSWPPRPGGGGGALKPGGRKTSSVDIGGTPGASRPPCWSALSAASSRSCSARMPSRICTRSSSSAPILVLCWRSSSMSASVDLACAHSICCSLMFAFS